MAGESGGAHTGVGRRLESHSETSPQLGEESQPLLGYRTVSFVPTERDGVLSNSLIEAANRGFRAREESWDGQTLHWCQSGPTKYALLTRQRLHDPLCTGNFKDQGLLDWSWSGVGGA